MEQIKWIDRTFSFGYSINYTPLFIERLKAIASRLEELLGNFDDALASARTGNAWSIKEHVGHLSDLEALHDGRIDDFIAGLPELRPADMTNKATYTANHNEQALPDLISAFRSKRAAYINRLESLDDIIFERKALHPRLKQVITLTDALFFTAEHDMQHLTTIAWLCRGKQ